MAAFPTTAALKSFPYRGWLQSPAWDVFWMLSGLWGIVVLVVSAQISSPLLILGAAFAFQRTVSTVHSWSTTFMVLGSPLLAEERRKKFVKYRLIPALLVSVGMGLGVYVGFFQRYPADGSFTLELWPWAVYLLLFWVGHFWHFGNQDFGVLTIYRAKAGQNRPIDRRIDKLYTVAMMFVIQPVAYVGLVASTAFAELVRTVFPFIPIIGVQAANVAIGVATLLAVGAIAFELAKPQRSLPKLLYILVIFLHPILLWGAVHTNNQTLGYAYVMAYLWSHWLIAISLVGRINTRFHRSRGDNLSSALARHVVVLSFISAAALLATRTYPEYALFNTVNFKYKELLAAITPETALAIGFVLGFLLSEQLLHYYCDRCLFRFRDAGVRQKVAPFLLGENGQPASASTATQPNA